MDQLEKGVQMSRAFQLQLEELEPRCLLAGNVFVTVSDGDLLVRGDAAANGVRITGTAPGQFLITGLAFNGGATTVNGLPALTVRGVTDDVLINLQGGNDFLRLNGAAVVRDDLAINTGGGNDSFLLEGVTVFGETNIDGSAGDDTLVVRASAFVGEVALNMNSGNDRVVINAVSRFFSEVDFELGDGHDLLIIGGSFFADEVLVEGGSGFDAFHDFGGSSFADELEIDEFDAISPIISSVNDLEIDD
jgi:hypothetical protein